MMTILATVLFLLLASSNASKYIHPFHQFYQDKEPYPDTADGNEGESTGMLAKLAAKLRAEVDEDGWESFPDPRMYVLTELESPGGTSHLQESFQDDFRTKRKRPSLSINNALEVLQDKWRLDLLRKEKAENLKKIERNKQLLSSIGKRSLMRADLVPAGRLSNEHPSRFHLRSYQT